MPPPAAPPPAAPLLAPPLLAVARDAAFCFHYPDNLTLLEAAGAQIAYFKPTCGERLPADAAGVYLGGGYPELHAKALSENLALWNDLRMARARDIPIFAECGGFMTLTEALIDDQGRRWPMAGLVPGVTRMTKRLAGFGYRYATALKPNLLVAAGETLRAHEFHYSAWEHETPPRASNAESPPPFAWMSRPSRKDAASAPCGYASGNLLASYLHIHLGQRATLAARLVALMKNPRAGLSQ
jgi:cobyrinic acid a,c-diamide synthase